MKQISVIQLSAYLEALVEADANLALPFALLGEVTNLKNAAGGHLYFTLKDEAEGRKAQIDCKMWAAAHKKAAYEPQDGDRVIAVGQLGIYAAQGRYSFIVSDIKAVEGEGSLARLEALKKKLAAEGLFRAEVKKPLPPFPKRIGVVTSPHGAAIHDIIRVAKARNRGIEIILYPAKVQGAGAAEEIAAGLGFFNRRRDLAVDVVVVGRGGGSLEDLWEFNSETVARAIYASKIPVVSAVGHESDFTLADLAADVRAATPSNAMEIVVPEAAVLRRRLEEQERRLGRLLLQQTGAARERLNRLWDRGGLLFQNLLERRRHEHLRRQERLAMLNPMATMERGYAIVSRLDNGRIIKDAAEIAVGENVRIIFAKGGVTAKVESIP